MVNDSLVLVNLDSDVCVGLSGNSSGLDELPLGILVDVIAALSGVDVRTVVLAWNLLLPLSIVYLFRASSH